MSDSYRVRDGDPVQESLDAAETALNVAMDAIRQARSETLDPNERVKINMARLRKDRRAAGLCANCGDPSSNKYHCAKCRRKNNPLT